MHKIPCWVRDEVPIDFVGCYWNTLGMRYCHVTKGRHLHRLDGPALYDNNGLEYYFIYEGNSEVDDDETGEPIDKEVYWCDPRVVKFNINKKLKAIEDADF